jgi:hypothetical protein
MISLSSTTKIFFAGPDADSVLINVLTESAVRAFPTALSVKTIHWPCHTVQILRPLMGTWQGVP